MLRQTNQPTNRPCPRIGRKHVTKPLKVFTLRQLTQLRNCLATTTNIRPQLLAMPANSLPLRCTPSADSAGSPVELSPTLPHPTFRALTQHIRHNRITAFGGHNAWISGGVLTQCPKRIPKTEKTWSLNANSTSDNHSYVLSAYPAGTIGASHHVLASQPANLGGHRGRPLSLAGLTRHMRERGI